MEPQEGSDKSIWEQVKDKLKHRAIQVNEYPAETEHPELESMGVTWDGYPTIFKYVNGHVSYFPGDKQRTVQNIVHWAWEHKRSFHGGKKRSTKRRKTCKNCVSIGKWWKLFTK
jgi:hypothetical protein